ncbi:MAG: pyridoxamine 5'-phosphate oxidase [Verrucomicrobiales bacterium]
MTDSVSKSIADLRREYRAGRLSREDLEASPFVQFQNWFAEAAHSGIREANAMTLSTVGLDGGPSSRTLLMKDFDENGVAFFTSYTSRKAMELDANPAVSLLFFWKELERQVHVRGRAVKTSRNESRAYFFSRPYDSRIGAWASKQSDVIPARDWLEKRVAKYTALYPDTGEEDCVPLPDFWGGYRIVPRTIEFWQGQPGRNHDRFVYARSGDAGEWNIQRLSP